jgi:hypothetical protein
MWKIIIYDKNAKTISAINITAKLPTKNSKYYSLDVISDLSLTIKRLLLRLWSNLKPNLTTTSRPGSSARLSHFNIILVVFNANKKFFCVFIYQRCSLYSVAK